MEKTARGIILLLVIAILSVVLIKLVIQDTPNLTAVSKDSPAESKPEPEPESELKLLSPIISQKEYNKYVDYLINNGYTFIESSSRSYNHTVLSNDEFISIYGESYYLYDDVYAYGYLNANYMVVEPKYIIPRGIIGMRLADFDNDSKNEMLVITSGKIKEQMHPDDLTEYILTATMLVEQDGRIIEKAAVDFTEVYVLRNLSFGSTDIFTKDLDDKTLIGYTSYIRGSYDNADYAKWSLFAYAYKDGRFTNVLGEILLESFMYEGHYLLEGTGDRIVNAGFTSVTDSSNEGNLVDVEPNVKTLCSISYEPASLDNYKIYDVIVNGDPQNTLSPIRVDIYSTVEIESQE